MRDKRMGKKDSEGNELKRGKEARGWVGVVRGEHSLFGLFISYCTINVP